MDLSSFLSTLELPWAACLLDAPVEPEAERQFNSWLADGRNATMDYMANYRDLRSDPRLLLDGAQTLIAVHKKLGKAVYTLGGKVEFTDGIVKVPGCTVGFFEL